MRNIEEVEPARGIVDILKMNELELEKSNLVNILENTNQNQDTNYDANHDAIMNKTHDKTKERYYDNTVDFRYICIKKEHFDVNMIYLKYTNLKKENYIEIIYKSPSIFLDGLFFKTPPLNASQLSIGTKGRVPFTSVITCVLDKVANSEFINLIKSIDTYISNYIIRHARDINLKMNEDENHYLNYETILKPWYNQNKKSANANAYANTNVNLPYAAIAAGNTSKKATCNFAISFKSYLERSVLDTIKRSILDKSISNTEKKYVITFNISNIYFSNAALTPLIKCNKCEEVV